MNMYSNTIHGVVQWQWKVEGQVSPEYKSLNHQWWTPNKSDFENVTKLYSAVRQEAKNEIWEDLQSEIQWTKDRYKQHKQNKKESVKWKI